MSLFFMNLKRNLKAAFITVKTNFREYICLLAALIVVEMLFGTVTAAMCNNRKVEKDAILEDGYYYHCAIIGADESDQNVLANKYTYYRIQNKLTFSIENYENEVRIVFTKDYRNTMKIFEEALAEMNDGNKHASLVKTPLYDYEISGGGTFGTILPILLLLSGLSFVLLTVLFRTRINHFKFTYSIYLTYGGDFKKLLSSAFYETLLLVLLAFVPAAVLSYGAAALLYLPFGRSFGFFFLPIPLMLIFPLLCSIPALILPIRILASTAPIKLMRAQDNSNMVSSPRKSARFLKKSPVFTETKALWRFRKHLLLLLLSTVSFAVIFLAGCYIADAYTVRTDTNRAEITVKLASEEEYLPFVGFFGKQAEGNDVHCVVEKITEDPADGDRILPHLVLERSKGNVGYFTECAGNSDYLATDALEIRAFDGDALSALEAVYGYKYSGDPQKLLTDENSVIVSSSLANNKANSLAPGDRVFLPVGYIPLPNAAHIEAALVNLDTELQNNIFMYREFTVAAVVTNYSDYTNMLLYLPTVCSEGESSAYEAVMGVPPRFTRINLYTESERDEEICAMIVQDYLSDYGGISYERNHASLADKIKEGKNYHGLIVLISLFFLAVSPLAGIFSQVLFYDKRHLEFDVLRAVGAEKKDFVKMFAVDGLAVSVLSGGCYAALSALTVRLLCRFLNSPYAFIFTSDSGRATTFYPTIPTVPFMIGLCLTVLFAVCGVLLPAMLYKKAASDHIAENFAQTEEV